MVTRFTLDTHTSTLENIHEHNCFFLEIMHLRRAINTDITPEVKSEKTDIKMFAIVSTASHEIARSTSLICIRDMEEV